MSEQASETSATERPILMKGWCVRAILEGRKTQTRRVVKPQPHIDWYGYAALTEEFEEIPCPHGNPGDILWVRETWATEGKYDSLPPRDLPDDALIMYRADEGMLMHDACLSGRTRASIHLPRRFCRIRLRIEDIRVERLQEISAEDAISEGLHQSPTGGCWVGSSGYGNPRLVFKELWDEINGDRGFPWMSNPWVWVIEFQP